MNNPKEIKSSTPYFSKWLKSSIEKPFFENVLNEFGKELQSLAYNWYNYIDEDGSDGTKDVFALIERSYVGVLNNAVIKCYNKDSVLQEYSVWNEKNVNVGRADYLVKHDPGKDEIIFLFEAKQREYDGVVYDNKGMSVFYESFIEQGKKYYDAEKKYFTTLTYVVPIIFEWVRHPKHLDDLLKDNSEDGQTDFYCLYHNGEGGLMVYGKLVKMEKEK